MKLLDYIRGDRKGREARRIELEAMRDPLLGDALEGFDSVEGDHEGTIGRLRERIAGRASLTGGRQLNRRRRTLGVAAGLLLCASIGGLYLLSEAIDEKPFTLTAKLDDDDLFREVGGVQVLSKKLQYLPSGTVYDHKPSIYADRGMPTVALAAVVVTANMPEARIPANHDNAIAMASIREQAEYQTDISADMMENVAAASPVTGALRSEEAETLPETRKVYDTATDAVRIRGMAKLKEDAHTVVTGRVVDNGGEPVVGAIVAEKGTGKYAVTDMQGGFRIEGVAENPKLEVNYIGYETAVVTGVPDSLPVVIAMNESANRMDEVVVTGYGTAKKRRVAGSVASASVGEPKQTETDKFYKYVSKNLRPQKDVAGDSVKGEVEAEFYIDDKGRPRDIRIVKSLCPNADKEAVRLIEEGPRWTRTTEKRKVTIEFR